MEAMALHRVLPLDNLPAGALEQANVAGREIVLCHHDGVIRAFQGSCPHRNGPLGHGNLDNGRIVCPWHAWSFSAETGTLDFNPEVKLAQYDVSVENGDVFVVIP
jgi:nitrite reductase (NADH) small subunit